MTHKSYALERIPEVLGAADPLKQWSELADNVDGLSFGAISNGFNGFVMCVLVSKDNLAFYRRAGDDEERILVRADNSDGKMFEIMSFAFLAYAELAAGVDKR